MSPFGVMSVAAETEFSVETFRMTHKMYLAVFAIAIAMASRANGYRAEIAAPREAASVHALFNLDSPDTGPFPSDRFTIADPSQNTGLRVRLPLPDCGTRPSDCQDLEIINTLDGFNLQPRLSIPFDGPIDVNTVTSQTVFLISAGSTSFATAPGPTVSGINQVVWDPETNTLHVESDELLDQHTRYVLIVTRRVKDLMGRPLEAAGAFQAFRHGLKVGQRDDDPGVTSYRQALIAGLERAAAGGLDLNAVAVASVFTTQSATAILEKIRDQIELTIPDPADFLLGPGNTRTVFALADMTGLTSDQQTRVDPPVFNRVNLDLSLLRVFPGVVGQLAFGKYRSPDYQVHPGEFLPPTGTRTGVPVAQNVREIYFNLVLPSGTRPTDGWPVAIFGHAGGDNKNAAMRVVAASMAQRGIATILINSVGHGLGPLGTLTVARAGATPVRFAAGGRAIDQDGNGIYTNREGMTAAPAGGIIGARDGFRQTAVDLMQLARVIEIGVDVDGDSGVDLNPARVYYFGQSQGGNYGMLFAAVEPDVHTVVLNVPGSPLIDNDRLSPDRRSDIGEQLAARVPPLLNAPGITTYAEVSVPAPVFNDNLPLRDGIPLIAHLADNTTVEIRSPVINTVDGSMGIQRFVDNTEWVFQSGSSVAYARYLTRSPLAGMPAKSVIVQFAKGDLTNPNPVTTAILRAGNLANDATFYRHDLAYAEYSGVSPNPLGPNPHVFLTSFANEARRQISLGAQAQIASFFASDGTQVIHPEPWRFFEVPISPPLPENLTFIPRTP